MKIWLPENAAVQTAGVLDIGYLAAPDCVTPSDAAVTVSIEVVPTGTAAAWIVPAGLGTHIDLLKKLSTMTGPVYVAVNGLGAASLAAVRDCIPETRLVWLFDAREQERIAYFEQLAWLATRDAPFVVMARSVDKLLEAMIAGARELVVPDVLHFDLAPLERVAASMTLSSNRPVSGTEVDHLHGVEASLVAARTIVKGSAIVTEDLAIAVTPERGISPHLRDKLAGKIARYDIKEGEALNFGQLRDLDDV